MGFLAFPLPLAQLLPASFFLGGKLLPMTLLLFGKLPLAPLFFCFEASEFVTLSFFAQPLRFDTWISAPAPVCRPR